MRENDGKNREKREAVVKRGKKGGSSRKKRDL